MNRNPKKDDFRLDLHGPQRPAASPDDTEVVGEPAAPPDLARSEQEEVLPADDKGALEAALPEAVRPDEVDKGADEPVAVGGTESTESQENTVGAEEGESVAADNGGAGPSEGGNASIDAASPMDSPPDESASTDTIGAEGSESGKPVETARSDKVALEQGWDTADLPTVNVDRGEAPQRTLTRMATVYGEAGLYAWESGGQLAQPVGGKDGDEFVRSFGANELPHVSLELCHFLYWANGDPHPDLLTPTLARAFCGSRATKLLKQLRRVYKNFAVGHDLKLLEHGYNPGSLAYLCGPVVEPASGTARLDEMLDTIDFKDESSRSNFVAMLASPHLYEHLGRTPPALIVGDGPEAGKTHAAKALKIITDGTRRPTTIGLGSDAENEKRIGGLLNRSERTVIIDNAKSAAGSQAISSSALERMMTDERISVRQLRANQFITRDNDLLWCVTANSPLFSPDLASRGVSISLNAPTGNGRTYRFANLLEHLYKHRLEILAEILGMIVRWRDAGAVQDTTVRHREMTWATSIGGLLKVNGFNGFLSNYVESKAAHDIELRELLIVMRELAKNHPKFSSLDIGAKARSMRLLQGTLARWMSESAITQKVSKLVGRVVGEPFEFEGTIVTIRRHEGRHIYYSFSEESPGAPTRV